MSLKTTLLLVGLSLAAVPFLSALALRSVAGFKWGAILGLGIGNYVAFALSPYGWLLGVVDFLLAALIGTIAILRFLNQPEEIELQVFPGGSYYVKATTPGIVALRRQAPSIPHPQGYTLPVKSHLHLPV